MLPGTPVAVRHTSVMAIIVHANTHAQSHMHRTHKTHEKTNK